ncbi:MAG: molybdenum cofactor guanylyltransferase, partial [Candidatus Bathyarchaeia archaeon]
ALEFSDEILVVVGREEDIEGLRDILPSQVRVVSDILPGRGPLVGIYSGFRHLRSEYSVVLPCDSPFIQVDLMRYLIERVEGLDAAVPLWPNGYVEPLHSVYRVKAALRAAEEAVKGEKLRVHDMMRRLEKVAYVPMEELKKFDPGLLTFFNINSSLDLRVAEDILSAR